MQVRRRGNRDSGQWKGQGDPSQPSQLETSLPPPQPTPLYPDPLQPSKKHTGRGRGKGRRQSSHLHTSSSPPQPTPLSPDSPQPTPLYADPPQPSKQHTGRGQGNGHQQSSHLLTSLTPPLSTTLSPDPPESSKLRTRQGRGKGRPQSCHLRTGSPPPQLNSPSSGPLQHTPLHPDPTQSSKQHTGSGRGKGRPKSSHLRTSSPPPQPALLSPDPPEPTPLSPDPQQPTPLFPDPPQPTKPRTRWGQGKGRQQSFQLLISTAVPQPTPNIPVPSPSISGGLSNSTSDSSGSPSSSPILMPSYGGASGEFDRRKIISVEAVSNPRRFIPPSVTRDIISNVIMEMPIPAEKWHHYPIDTKNKLFKDFMDKYKLTSDYDRTIARTVWERTCKDRYPDHLKNMRKMALKQVNSTNLADTKGLRPKGINAKIWNGLVDIWLSPEWINKSDACRRNRAANPDAVLHTGGSISFGEHKKRMEAELKQPVSCRDVYDHVHKTKAGEYVSQYSKKFIESYDNAMSRKYGGDPSRHPVVDPEVWAAVSSPNKVVSGSNKKRRIIVGHSLDINLDESTPASSSKVPGPSLTVAPTPAQGGIKEAVDSAMATFVQSQLVPMLEPILSRIVASQVRNLEPTVPFQGGVAEDDLNDD